MRAQQLAAFPPVPGRPAPLRAPRPGSSLGLFSEPPPRLRHRRFGHSPRFQHSPSSPPRRAGHAGLSPQAAGRTRGASVGSSAKTTPRPPPRPRPLFSTSGTSYRRCSAELRPAPGVDRTVPLRRLLGVGGLQEETGWRELEWGG